MTEGLHFSVVGGSIWGNRGAEAMLVTTISQIREVAPDAVFDVYTIYPDKDRYLVDDARVQFHNGKPLAFGLLYFPLALIYRLLSFLSIGLPLPASLKRMKESVCLLDMGGITFSDGRSLQLLYNVFSIWPAMLLGVSVVKLSQAMGPFNTPLNRFMARTFLQKCKMIFPRGTITAEHLKTLGLPVNLTKSAADIAFLYQPDDSLSEENEEKVAYLVEALASIHDNGGNVVSIIPSSLVLSQSRSVRGEYGAKILAILQEVCQGNGHILILPNASRAGSGKVMNNDLVAIDVLRKNAVQTLPPEVLERVHWVDFDINTRSIRALVGKTDALVTSRFHGMVAGLALCVPTMVIGWSHKYRETLADFGMAGYAINYELGLEETLTIFRDFWKNKAQIQGLLEGRVEAVRTSASTQFDYLREEIRLEIGG